MVRVSDVHALHAVLLYKGIRILDAPTEYALSGREFNAEDLAGHRWTFSQTVADVDPGDWGGAYIHQE